MNNPYELFLTRFADFTDIQKSAFKIIDEGNNCIITAPTGSGKTEAALLPILDRIKKQDGKGIFAIYITPLRALNRDLIKRLEWLGGELGIDIAVRHGDTTMGERRAQSLNPPQVLITTPESMQNLLLSRNLRRALSNLKVVIVDELHELYYNKRGAQLSVALERFEEVSGNFQRIGISATIGNVEEASRYLFGSRTHKVVESLLKKTFDFTVDMPVRPEKDNKDFRVTFGLDLQAYARIERVAELIRSSSATLVFSNTRQAV
ncbi:MAG: DEAD/DEAH box helicase, partial [Candidatus Micrarchaeota archaeon]|nr:DEAD/DEAH box helicase [Candidatus Micrarchaeota archaeon]